MFIKHHACLCWCNMTCYKSIRIIEAHTSRYRLKPRLCLVASMTPTVPFKLSQSPQGLYMQVLRNTFTMASVSNSAIGSIQQLAQRCQSWQRNSVPIWLDRDRKSCHVTTVLDNCAGDWICWKHWLLWCIHPHSCPDCSSSMLQMKQCILCQQPPSSKLRCCLIMCKSSVFWTYSNHGWNTTSFAPQQAG